MLLELIAAVFAKHRIRFYPNGDGKTWYWACPCPDAGHQVGVDGFPDGYAAQADAQRHLAAEILDAIEASQPHHLIELFDDGSWVIQHSMACRLSGKLFDCEVNKAALQLAGPPLEPGRYTCELVDGILVIGEAATADA